MATHLEKLLSVQKIELIASRGGAFEISVDGRVIFSKLAMGRFPNEGEIEGMLSEML